MPGPPPPPPPAVPPPMFNNAAPAFNPPKGGADDRAALLKSIQRGTKLKKTVTNDKSAPVIGKVASSNSNNNGNGGSYSGSSSLPTPMGLGGLFAGGMPKLKPTKNRLANNVSTNNQTEIQNGYTKSTIREKSPVQNPSASSFNFNSIQNEVKKKLANDNRERGPPPPKPTATESVTAEFNNISIQQSNSSNNFLQTNNSSLHRKTQSNVNLSAIEQNLSTASSLSVSSKSISHGKPNLAPKPPALNNGNKPRTPPKKLVTNGKVSRAHSLKSPRSPTTADPPLDAAIKYGTVRNMSSVLSNSIGNNLNSRSKMMLNGRPSAPPPSIPVPHTHAPPAPPSKTSLMKPPNHAPPPPPSTIPQPPNHAPPPPPPSKTLTVKSTGSSFSPSQAPPPPPPPRNSSMRDQNRKQAPQDFDERFRDLFRSPNSFPKPPPFRNVLKVYANRQAGSKQQAPPPPSPILPSSRVWNVPSNC